MNPALFRMLLVAAIAVASVISFRVWKRWSLRRSTVRFRETGSAGQLSLLYFSGPNCAQCAAQEAVIRDVEALEPTVEFSSYDASVDLVIAARVGVMSVPTTVIIDEAGRVHARNGRFVTADVLRSQLDAAKAEPRALAGVDGNEQTN